MRKGLLVCSRYLITAEGQQIPHLKFVNPHHLLVSSHELRTRVSHTFTRDIPNPRTGTYLAHITCLRDWFALPGLLNVDDVHLDG